MASLRTTPEGWHEVFNADNNLSSLQVRALMLCKQGPVTFFDLVQTIRSERELALLNEEVIAKDVANLCVRGLIVRDKNK